MANLIDEDDVMQELEEQVAEQARLTINESNFVAEGENSWMIQENGNEPELLDQNDPDEGLWDTEDAERIAALTKIQFPEEVKSFLLSLYVEIYERNIENIRRLYENDYYYIGEKYYEHSRWPSCDSVRQFYIDMNRYHSLIMTLYIELYYRHAFSKFPNFITWEDRKLSWNNYRRLLEHFLEDEIHRDEEDKGLRLPMQWVHDMLDEFVYQFQDTCRWRSKLLKGLGDGTECSLEYKQLIKCAMEDVDVWKGSQVFEFMLSFVQQSDIYNFLNQIKEEYSRVNALEFELRYQLGYFSIISLLRLYVLLGDYYTALQVINNLEVSPRSLYWKIASCHISVFYYLGFAYMMLKRYSDAIRTVSQLLIFVSKQKNYLSSQPHHLGMMMKTLDKMYMIVLLCQSLCNCRLDETINQVLKEKYSDKIYQLQQDNEIAYKKVFNSCTPKFINPVTLHNQRCRESANNLLVAYAKPNMRQLNFFLKDVAMLKKISNVRSYIKLYNNIQLQKLANLMGMKDKDADSIIRSDMISIKLNSRQQVWKSGPLTSGDFVYLSHEIDFFIDMDKIYVKSLKSQKIYVDYFLKQIDRYQDLIYYMQNSTIQRPLKADPQLEKNSNTIDNSKNTYSAVA